MKYLLLTLAFLSFNVFASDDWFLLSDSKTYKVEVKYGSFKSSDIFGSVILRSTIKDKNPLFEVAVMKRTDCNAGFGSIFYYETDATYKSSSPYVSKGGTFASGTGDLICGLLAKGDV